MGSEKSSATVPDRGGAWRPSLPWPEAKPRIPDSLQLKGHWLRTRTTGGVSRERECHGNPGSGSCPELRRPVFTPPRSAMARAVWARPRHFSIPRHGHGRRRVVTGVARGGDRLRDRPFSYDSSFGERAGFPTDPSSALLVRILLSPPADYGPESGVAARRPPNGACRPASSAPGLSSQIDGTDLSG